jgi:hypothetical protein
MNNDENHPRSVVRFIVSNPKNQQQQQQQQLTPETANTRYSHYTSFSCVATGGATYRRIAVSRRRLQNANEQNVRKIRET